MNASTRAAHGPRRLPECGHAATACQATWRFLNNDRVELTELAQPLRQAARDGCVGSESDYVLIVHDWCKLDYKSHSSKIDLLQLTHEHDIGYDLTTSLAVEAKTGVPLAPIQMHLKTGETVHSTAANPPAWDDHHLAQLEPTMDEVAQMDLPRTPVHVIDREADSLGHFRSWVDKDPGHLFLVRCDDRRVKWDGESVLLSELNEHLDRECLFEDAGTAKYHGKKVRRQVAEVSVVADGTHTTRSGGERKYVRGKAIELRAVFVRLLDKDDYILAEWMLLTNVPAEDVDTAEISLWYYFRWQIESFFKLLKSSGHELEYWQQTSGIAIARRLLIAAMACVFIDELRRSKSEEAERFRKFLMQLSGRTTKHGVDHTASALLAGYFVFVSMLQFLEQGPPIEELKKLAESCGMPL